MRDIATSPAGDLTVTDTARIMRDVVVTGDLYAVAGVRLVVDGTVTGDLHVGHGADVTLNGQISGTLHNAGGRVTGVGLRGTDDASLRPAA